MPTDEPVKQTHPSFGLLSFARATSSMDQKLFGSSIGHRNTMRLELHEAELNRRLNYDSYFPTGKLFEIEMSPTQFADLITSANAGVGVPVTIRWTRAKGNTPPVPVETKRHQFEREFAEKIKDITKRVEKVGKDCENKLKATGTLSKADRLAIAENLYFLVMEVRSNLPFIATQWNEQLDTTISEAKGEVEGFFHNLISQLGVEGLKARLEQILPELPTNETTRDIQTQLEG